jgi:hypothetical protein
MAPIVPGVAITLIGIGLFARDGLLLLLGAAVIGGAMWFVITSVV